MENIIKVVPQKDFFINMITKDITLEASILELIDNSIDGYKRSKVSNAKVDIEIGTDFISISDNCGGIPIDIAINYAFNFGRTDEDYEKNSVEKSIGRFGIGMKRAIFKMGQIINIETYDGSDSYRIGIDINVWKNLKEWNFEYKLIEKTDIGTRIIIEDLYEGIQKIIKDTVFINKLSNMIADNFREYLNGQIEITLKYMGKEFDIKSNCHIEELVNNDLIKPLIEEESRDGLELKFIVGAINRIQDGKNYDPNKAGWYLFCNDRLVIQADQTKLTVWGVNQISNFRVEKARRFRGYCYVNSDDARKLPWNTTKTSVEEENDLYIYIKNKMIKYTELYLNIISKMEELDVIQDKEIIANYDIGSLPVSKDMNYVDKLDYKDMFVNISRKIPEKVSIVYKKDRNLVDKIRRVYDLTTASDVGRFTFDYFTDMEEFK